MYIHRGRKFEAVSANFSSEALVFGLVTLHNLVFFTQSLTRLFKKFLKVDHVYESNLIDTGLQYVQSSVDEYM